MRLRLKALFMLVFVLGFAPLMRAQNITSVEASHVADSSQALLVSGQICLQPMNPFSATNPVQNPTSGFQVGGLGLAFGRPVCANVTNGVMNTTTVAASDHTSPLGVGYQVTVIDNNTGESWILGTTLITGSVFNLDAWSTSGIVTLPNPGSAAITGPLTGTSTAIFSGDVTAPNFHGAADFAKQWPSPRTSCPAGFAPTSQDQAGNWTNCVATSGQTSGSTSGVIAQNPAGSQMITVPSGFFQNIGGPSGHASIDSNGNVAGTSFTGPSFTGQAGTFGIANGVYNAGSCGTANAPSWCSGTDLGGWVNAAFNNCTNKCTVYIPAGTYSYATTINLPVNSNGATALQCDSGAVLDYTGTSYALQALGTNGNNTTANVKISGGCVINGTSAALGGIHLRSFGGGAFQNLVIEEFTNGDGWFNEGANTINCFACYFQVNKNGIHNVGVVLSGTNYAPNAVKFYGGAVASNSQWGVFEDASLSATAGPTQNDAYFGMVFETNGSNSNASASGQAFIQRCDACSISNAYMEYAAGSTVANQIVLGDSSNPVNDLMLINNFFGSTSAQTNTINCVQCIRPILLGNAEEGNPTNFFNTNTLTSSVYFGMNPGFAAAHFIVGTGTFVFGLQGNNQLVSVKNTLDDGFGNANFFGNAAVGNGTNIVYRCTAAGAVLPVGALTTVSTDCGAFPQDTGLRTR